MFGSAQSRFPALRQLAGLPEKPPRSEGRGREDCGRVPIHGEPIVYLGTFHLPGVSSHLHFPPSQYANLPLLSAVLPDLQFQITVHGLLSGLCRRRSEQLLPLIGLVLEYRRRGGLDLPH